MVDGVPCDRTSVAADFHPIAPPDMIVPEYQVVESALNPDLAIPHLVVGESQRPRNLAMQAKNPDPAPDSGNPIMIKAKRFHTRRHLHPHACRAFRIATLQIDHVADREGTALQMQTDPSVTKLQHPVILYLTTLSARRDHDGSVQTSKTEPSYRIPAALDRNASFNNDVVLLPGKQPHPVPFDHHVFPIDPRTEENLSPIFAVLLEHLPDPAIGALPRPVTIGGTYLHIDIPPGSSRVMTHFKPDRLKGCLRTV